MNGGHGAGHAPPGQHPVHEHGGGALETVLPPVLVLLLALAYLLLVHRARARNPVQSWGRARTGLFLAGCLLLACALLPPVAPFARTDFRGHMLQHLLIGMYAPLALMLGAPVTLLLRTLPARRARLLTGLLRSRPLKLLAHPVTALVLSTGALAALYFTPLYQVATVHPAAHWLLNAHFLFSGCLFAWVIAGPDPAPVRPGVPARLVVLGAAVAFHATVSQLLYGGFLVGVHAPVEQVRGGGEIMYYGGDIAELLLAVALVTTWRPSRPRPADPAPTCGDGSAVSRTPHVLSGM